MTAPLEPLDPAEAVLRFLSSVGPSADAELYLRLFRSRAKESFATIVVESDAIAEAADSVAVDLRFLRTLGLTPVVFLGLFDHAHAGAQRDKLNDLLNDLGVPTQRFDAGADCAEVAAATARREIPLVASAHAGTDRGAAVATLSRLLFGLHSQKLIVLGPQGGLTSGGERLSVVNLTTQYTALVEADDLSARDLRLLELCRELVLQPAANALGVSVTSPINLLRELFTVKGAGTLLRRGARIKRHDGYQGVDVAQLRALLTSSFGAPPNEALFARALAHCYLEADHRGAALIMATPRFGYLSKFAVTREAQGEGIGQDLFEALSADYPALVWRARPDNPVRAWYERTCDGRYASGPWIVYERGLPPEQLADAIAFAIAQPRDF